MDKNSYPVLNRLGAIKLLSIIKKQLPDFQLCTDWEEMKRNINTHKEQRNGKRYGNHRSPILDARLPHAFTAERVNKAVHTPVMPLLTELPITPELLPCPVLHPNKDPLPILQLPRQRVESARKAGVTRTPSSTTRMPLL